MDDLDLECRAIKNAKKQLLDKLSKEPLMVLSTAYIYAKNYVNYGEDITKAWNTAVQQASIIEQVKIKAYAEAYDSFKKDYENSLKADKIDMLEGLNQQIDEIIRDRIDKLKEDDVFVNKYEDGTRLIINDMPEFLKEKSDD